ncbi:hypothetical protein CRYUN_Cryun13aG0013300 [Craigia yunnanensis]
MSAESGMYSIIGYQSIFIKLPLRRKALESRMDISSKVHLQVSDEKPCLVVYWSLAKHELPISLSLPGCLDESSYGVLPFCSDMNFSCTIG